MKRARILTSLVPAAILALLVIAPATTGSFAAMAQEVPTTGCEPQCLQCHPMCDTPPGPNMCGFWPGDPECRTVTTTYCVQFEPGGVGSSFCWEEVEHWYWS